MTGVHESNRHVSSRRRARRDRARPSPPRAHRRHRPRHLRLHLRQRPVAVPVDALQRAGPPHGPRVHRHRRGGRSGGQRPRCRRSCRGAVRLVGQHLRLLHRGAADRLPPRRRMGRSRGRRRSGRSGAGAAGPGHAGQASGRPGLGADAVAADAVRRVLHRPPRRGHRRRAGRPHRDRHRRRCRRSLRRARGETAGRGADHPDGQAPTAPTWAASSARRTSSPPAARKASNACWN